MDNKAMYRFSYGLFVLTAKDGDKDNGCIINMGAIVDHKGLLGVGVHVAPGAIIKGENVIEAFAKIESGEVIQRGEFPFADSSKR